MNERELISIREARRLVAHLMRRDAHIYWADFLFSTALGWGGFYLAVMAPFPSPGFFLALMVTALAFYRAAIFIHELSHFRPDEFPLFRLAWNALIGIPLLVPSFMYDGVHNDHHKPDVYGTGADGEYVPFALHRPLEMIVFLLSALLVPLLFAIRFLVLAPLSWVIPPLRPIVWARASSLVIDPAYVRPKHAIRSDPNWRVQEVAATLWAWLVLLMIWQGVLPAKALAVWYATAVIVFFLNGLRTLAAHAYRNPPEHVMSREEQFLDSVDVPGHPFFTTLWAPVGLRYHATHHLFPSMPYHNLGEAHRILKARFPEAYARMTRPSLRLALVQIWREAREKRRSGAP